jgi:hypothetical protein
MKHFCSSATVCWTLRQ